MSYKIPIFKLHYDEDDRKHIHNGINNILDQGFLTNHTYVSDFENRFAEWNSSKFSVAVNSGTSALEVILRALDVKGKEVILPTNTFIACAQAVFNSGATPVLCDIEDKYLSIDVNKVEQKINQNTAAIMIVHIGGLISPSIINLLNLCKKNGIHLLEDCAHSHGASFDGISAGNFGLAGAYSFHMTKVMTTGEGGVIVTQDKNLFEVIRSIRQFGKTNDNPIMHDRIGSNYKMTEMQGLLGVVELGRVGMRIRKRQQIASLYDELLRNSSWKTYSAAESAVCPYYKKIIIPPVARNVVEEKLSKKGISLTGGVYYLPLHKQKIFKSQTKESFPVSDMFSNTHICPPCYPELKFEEVEMICKVLLEIAS